MTPRQALNIVKNALGDDVFQEHEWGEEEDYREFITAWDALCAAVLLGQSVADGASEMFKEKK